MNDLSPQLDPTHLAVARLPAGWQPPTLPDGSFVAVISSDLEVTLICPEELLASGDWAADAIATDIGWRRITFPGPLPWEMVGFLADVASRLAGAQIPFTSVSGFTTDHVLVRAAHADLAVGVLSGQEPPPQRPGTNP
jgi:hypothetical protein